MTDREIYFRAVDKAIAGGWDKNKLNIENIVQDFGLKFTIGHTIFSHQFLKAFWGEGLEENPLKYLEKFL